MSSGNGDLDVYVARQAQTVGRSYAEPPKKAPPASPLGKFRNASGACLGIFDEYRPEWGSGHAGAVCFAPDGRSVYSGRGDGVLSRIALPSGAVLWATPRPTTNSSGNGFYDLAASPDGRLVLAAYRELELRAYDADSGSVLWKTKQTRSVSFSPDGKFFVTSGNNIYETATGDIVNTIDTKGGGHTIRWSPTGTHIAACGSMGVAVWDAKSGAMLYQRRVSDKDLNGIAWSADGKHLACASEDNGLWIVSPEWSYSPRRIEGHRNFLWCVATAHDGRRVASSANDHTIRIWTIADGAELALYEFPEDFTFRMAFSPDGTLLATTHPAVARLWDTSETLREVAPAPRLLSSGPLPPDLSVLPGALVALLRTGRSAPLSVLKDLLALTGGHAPSPEAEPLASHPGMLALASLKWPAPARISLALLALRESDDRAFAPPEATAAGDLRFRLLDALAGSPCEIRAPKVPVASIEHALEGIDDRVLLLLGSLGPEACADDPTLPLSLLSRLTEVSPKMVVDRRMLAIRVPTQSLGAAEARGPSVEPSGFASKGALPNVVPSQWTLPEDVFHYRELSGGLLYRARFGREPPRLRPLVIVLDVSPAAFGKVEALLRSAAHALAASLLDAQIPAFFLAAGGDNASRPLLRRADLFEILTARARAPVSTRKTLALASDLLVSLPSDGPFLPSIVLLSHPAFGAEEPDLPLPPRTLGLFVQYPGHPAEPAWKRRLARAVCLGPDHVDQLPKALADVLGGGAP